MADTIAKGGAKTGHPELLLKKLGFPGCWYLPSAGLVCARWQRPFRDPGGAVCRADLIGMVLMMAVAAALLSILYSVIGAVIPRYGADYCLASRVTNPALGFAFSLTSVGLLSFASGSLVASIFHTTIPSLARVLSIVTQEDTLANQVAAVSEPYAVTLWGTVLIIVLFFLLILPPKTTHRILFAGASLSLLAWVILSIELSQAGRGAFQAAWDSFIVDSSFLQRLQLADQMGMPVQGSPGTVVFAGLLLGFGLFAGFVNTINISAEVDRPQSNLWRGNLAAIVVWSGVIVAAVYFLRRHVSADWLSAQSFLYLSGDQTIQVMPFVPLYAAILQPNPGIVLLVGVCWLFGSVAMAHAFLYSCSRVILAWVNDHVAPDLLGFIHPGLKSPLVTVLLVCILADIGVTVSALDPACSILPDCCSS